MGNTRGLTDKPIEREVITEDGRVVAAHLSDVVTDPNSADAVQIPDADRYPSANATQQNPLAVHEASSPADALDPDETDVNEVQSLTEATAITAGTFTITFDGETTDAIAFDATAAQIQAALEALANVSPGDITVAGGPVPTAPATLTFGGNYAAQDVPLVTVDETDLTGTITVAEDTKGVSADE